MNLPSAIRKDCDLFALVGLHLLSPYFAFLAMLRWTSYSCPHCSGVFRRDYWPHSVRLGNGERICRECAKVFDDGSREWPELELTQRLRFLLPPSIIAITGGFLLCGIVTLFIAPRNVVNWVIGVIILVISLSPTIAWCLVRLICVLRSIRRYENEPSSVGRRLEVGRY
jgi:hypothetical protein